MAQASAPQAIRQLVEQFDRHFDAYHALCVRESDAEVRILTMTENGGQFLHRNRAKLRNSLCSQNFPKWKSTVRIVSPDIPRTFPLFALTLLVVDQAYYARTIVPAFIEFKVKYFGHEGVVLHSRDIRKAQHDFGILTNVACRKAFMSDLTSLMRDLDYRWITTVIHTQLHREKYGMAADNPYDLALTFCLERLLPLLESEKQSEVSVVAESRADARTRSLN